MQGPLDTVLSTLQGWGVTALEMLPNFVVALGILIVSFIAAKGVQRLIRRGIQRVSHNRQLDSLILGTVRLGVVMVGVLAALRVLHLDGTVASILAGVGVIGLALGFAFQDIMSNFVAGVILALRRPFRVGEVIKVGEFFGAVEGIDLRSTRGRTFQGQLVIIPNKELLSQYITNYTHHEVRRVDLEVGVSYDDDLEEAEEVAVLAVSEMTCRIPDKDVELYYSKFDSSSINFSIRFWIDPPQQDFLAARSEAIKRIKRAFDQAGITIPFPIQTLELGSSAEAHLRTLARDSNPTPSERGWRLKSEVRNHH